MFKFKLVAQLISSLLIVGVVGAAGSSFAAESAKSKTTVSAKTQARAKVSSVSKQVKKRVHVSMNSSRTVKTAKATNAKRRAAASFRLINETPPVLSFAQIQGLHNTPNPLALSTGSALVMDAVTGEVIYEKNANAILPIASITKLMTSLVALESKPAMGETIEVTTEDVDVYRHSRSRLKVGDQLTREEMMQLALMSSENRAANSLARTHPSGYKSFIKAMNDRAASLGMTQTRFVDSTGLSEHNQSSALDLAKLVQAANKHRAIREWTTTLDREMDVSGRRVMYRNSNPLVRSGSWEILLQKTGYIREAGRCVVMEFTSSGKKFVMVLLDSLTPQSRIQDANKLLKFVSDQMG